MAQLPAPGSQLSVSQINALKGVANANTSITTREQQYMAGSNTPNARPSISGICMPEDVVIVLDSINNTGTKASDPSFGPNNPNNTPDKMIYSGPTVSGQSWTPTSFKEFHSAYNTPPRVQVTLTPISCPGVWNGTGIPCRTRAMRTLTFFDGVPPYYYATAQTGSPSVPSPSTFTGWIGPATQNPLPAVEVTGLATPVAYVWAAVRDSLNCGTNFDLAFSAAYP